MTYDILINMEQTVIRCCHHNDGNFTWTPTESQDGDHTITVQVTDGSLTDSETLTVTVNEVNVAPVLNTIARL